jgi:signal transduction histidine kinase
MSEIRAIAAGLRLPEIESLRPAEVIRRVVRTHERRSRQTVAIEMGELPDQASLATKIVLFRTLEEALSNATRHGQGAPIRVRAGIVDESLAVCVADKGPGFVPERAFGNGHLGLANSRERAELLGGQLRIDSAPGEGAQVWILLPLPRPR